MGCHDSREVKLFKVPRRKLGNAFKKDLKERPGRFPG